MIQSAPAWIALLPLASFLGAAGWHDVRHHRIPNRLVATGTLLALAAHGLLPGGSGFLSAPVGGLGLLMAGTGLLMGAAALLPLYALGAMGAGDIKLLAMLGACLGPNHILGAVLFSLIAASLMSIPALRHRRPGGNKLPFALAVAFGTFAYIGMLWLRSAQP